MDCWRDKMPDGKPIKCASFTDWNTFCKLEPESSNFCRKNCKPGINGSDPNKGRRGYYEAKTHPWMESRKPIWRRRVTGRKIA